MVKIINYIALLIVALLLTLACTDDGDLQNYFVDHQNDSNFIAVDIPASILSINTKEVSDDVKEAVNSFKKLNVLVFKKNEDNASDYEKEKSAIKKILAKEQFKDLMRFKENNNMVIVKYLGTDKSIDQIIIFAYSNDKGLALVRVLGDKMDVNKALKIIMYARSNKFDKSKFKSLEGLF